MNILDKNHSALISIQEYISIYMYMGTSKLLGFFFKKIGQPRAKWHILPVRAYPGFDSIKQLGIFLLPPGWDATSLHRSPQHYFASTYVYTWVERGTKRVKCLA